MSDSTKPDAERNAEIEAFIKAEIGRQLSDIVNEEVTKEVDKKSQSLTKYAKIIGLLGLTGLLGICNYIMETALDRKVDARIGKVTASLELIRLHNLAAKLNYKNEIQEDDKFDVLASLRQAAANDRIRDDKSFQQALSKIIHNFVSSDMSAEIDEIFKLYESEILSSQDIVYSLLHHYGQRLAFRSSSENQDKSISIFTKLEDAGGRRQLKVSLYYRLLFTYKANGSAKEKSKDPVIALIQKCAILDIEERAFLIYDLLLRTDPSAWQKTPNSIGRAIEIVVRGLLNDYEKQLVAVLEAPPNMFSEYLKANPSKKTITEEQKSVVEDKQKTAVDKYLNEYFAGKTRPATLKDGYKPEYMKP